MKNEDLKKYGIILLALAGVVFIGLISHWTYSTWRLVDWATIIVCGYIGYQIYNHGKM